MIASTLLVTLRGYGYRVFSRPFELNITGVRTNSITPGKFDDWIHVFYNNGQNAWALHSFPCTTDPGTYWLKNPLARKGTAILKAGQYIGAYEIGKHRGKYTALVQRGRVTVIRDANRDKLLDFNNGKEETGNDFGINIHRANKTGTTVEVDKYSAGCQVLANIDDFNLLIKLAERHKSLYGNNFTYTLIDERNVANIPSAKKASRPARSQRV
jgi:hypothetical protein